MRPLQGGLKLEGKKEATTIPWTITRPSPPRKVRIPLIEKAQPLVSIDDRVRVGEKIAEKPGEFPISIHASISGKVTGVVDTIEIISDGKDEPILEIGRERHGWESLSNEETIRILHDSGVEVPVPPVVDTLILNGCESEPYLTSDYCLLTSHPVEVLKAGEILRRTLGAKEVVLAIEKDKEDAAEVLRSKIFFHRWPHSRVEVFPSSYPQEDERILARELVPPGQKALVLSVSTAFAAYEAVVHQKPFYERAVTVGGECVAQPRNFWLRVGTSVEEAVKYARGFLRQPEKIVLGGPMKGTAIDALDTPILKETRGILGLPKEIVEPESVEPCIRCGRCVDHCPAGISPVMITLAAEKGLFEVAKDYGVSLCIECGNCSYVCPAKRPMVELMRYASINAC